MNRYFSKKIDEISNNGESPRINICAIINTIMKNNLNPSSMKNTNTSHLMQMTTAASLLAMVESFGSTYNPANAHIALQALKDNLALNQQLVFDIQESKTRLANHKNNKNEMLLGVNKKVSLILLNLGSLGLSPATMQSVRVISKNFKYRPGKSQEEKPREAIRGTASPGENSAESSSDVIKSSRSAYKFAERRVNWFEELVNFISTIPGYQPNESNLTIASLKSYVSDLKQELEAWQRESGTLASLRTKRAQQLRNETDGMVTLCRQTKSYVKALYGPTSVEGKAMAQFRFVRN
ncbi:MAG: hypothetical protein CFE21_08915 [Bacteroidetes bacterium B1(2017)]|nr:MAG: hypothetical protein CFE21_08915 [Bacteroidetes bacterium B1(2017)]